MTEKIFKKEDKVYRLVCELIIDYGRVNYRLNLTWRMKGKRIWWVLPGYENKYRWETKTEDILKYLTKEEVIATATEEYLKYAPKENIKL
jgi:hypothetical protein